jgi:hypothetical protein
MVTYAQQNIIVWIRLKRRQCRIKENQVGKVAVVQAQE